MANGVSLPSKPVQLMGTLKPSQTLMSKFDVEAPMDHSNFVLAPPVATPDSPSKVLPTNMAPASVRQMPPMGLSPKVAASPPGPPFHQ